MHPKDRSCPGALRAVDPIAVHQAFALPNGLPRRSNPGPGGRQVRAGRGTGGLAELLVWVVRLAPPVYTPDAGLRARRLLVVSRRPALPAQSALPAPSTLPRPRRRWTVRARDGQPIASRRCTGPNIIGFNRPAGSASLPLVRQQTADLLRQWLVDDGLASTVATAWDARAAAFAATSGSGGPVGRSCGSQPAPSCSRTLPTPSWTTLIWPAPPRCVYRASIANLVAADPADLSHPPPAVARPPT